MNTRQKAALCFGLVTSLMLLAIQVVAKPSFVFAASGVSFAIPFTHIIMMDPKVGWNLVAIVVFVVAPMTAIGVFLLRHRSES